MPHISDSLSDTHRRLPPLVSPFTPSPLSVPGVGASEQLDDSFAGREGATDAIREREGGGAVVSAAGRASAAVISSAGARKEQQGARRTAGQTAGEGQAFGQSSGAQQCAQQSLCSCVLQHVGSASLQRNAISKNN